MKKLLLSLIILFFLPVEGRSQRVAPASVNITDYRQVGDMRVWTFVVKDSSIGQLISVVKNELEFAGVPALEIQQNLQLDYNKIGTPRKLQIKGSQYITKRGEYLGSNLEIIVNGQSEKIELERDGNFIRGYMTRSGREIDQETELPATMFAADRQFLDQIEMLLAARDIKVGQSIFDSFFVPQTMYIENISAFVESFDLITLYNEVRDSLFVIQFSRPQEMVVYFSADKRLLKAELPNQNTKIYLDIIRMIPRELLNQPSFTFDKFMGLLPLYFIYLVVAMLGLLFLTGNALRWPGLYVAMALGLLGFIAAIFTQVPLQEYFAKDYFFPKVKSGESVYLWGLVPALPAGMIQETIKLLLIMAGIKYFLLTHRRILISGAAIGAGFAVLEACYIASKLPAVEIFSLNLLEKSFLILLHIGSGVILAKAINSKSAKEGLLLFMAVVAANSWLRYLPIFVQQGVVKVELIYMIQPLVPIIILLVAISQLKKLNAARS
ncbi:MAG: hypothetical protein V3S17_04260 [candidate division Zixibacteria bacterium]